MQTYLLRSLSLVLLVTLLLPAPALNAATKHDDDGFLETVDESALRQAYQEAATGGEPVRILIVPGHEPGYGGAEFAGFYERELVVQIASRLQAELSGDPRLEVLVARGDEGWNSDFKRYFDRQEKGIKSFVEKHKDAMEDLLDELDEDDEENEDQAAHNKAPEDVALRLYGINKWGNERGVDLAIHLHLNDELGHAAGERGAHSGAAIYVPDDIYGNAEASRAVAEPLFARISAYTATSTFGLEQKGIVEDRDLIAIGANNTSEVPSVLIEYGYIYEPRITGEGATEEVLSDFAYATALGVRDALGVPTNPRFGTKALPYTFSTDLLEGATTTIATSTTPGDPMRTRGIYALQALLHSLGFYPGSEASLAVCPVSGIVGACTGDAVKAYQRAGSLEETGTLGPRTRALLNAAGAGAATSPAMQPVAPAAPAAPQAASPVATAPTASTPPPAGASAPSPACPAFPETLVEGSDDAATDGNVSRLQKALAADKAIYPEGLVTGYFGPATQKAIERLQATKGIAKEGDDGYGTLGPRTQTALKALCS